MRRGWVLIWSLLIEALVVIAPLFIPIPYIWRLGISFVLMIIVGFCLVYFWWAPRNLFFTFVPESRSKIVVRGDAFRKALIQWKDYQLGSQWNVIGFPGAGRSVFGGLRYYGFWPLDDIYIYDFQWTGIKEDGTIDPHPKETLDFILLKDDIYGLKEEKAEDKNLLPLDITVALTIRIVNPYRALFNVQNWLETVYNRVRPYIRDFITTDTYENFIKNPARMGIQIQTRLEEEKILNEFWQRYGVDIRKIEVKDIDPGKEYRDISLAKYLAEKEREKIEIQAEAEKNRLKIVADGEANRILRVYKEVEKHGELGKFIRALEALEKSPEKGTKWVVPFPEELLSLFKKRK